MTRNHQHPGAYQGQNGLAKVIIKVEEEKSYYRVAAVISQTGGGQSTHENGVAASYHIKLQLQFPKLYHNKPLVTTEIIT